MKTKSKKILLALLTTSLLVSCGGKVGDGPGAEDELAEHRETLHPEGDNIDGTYKATFITLNPHVNGTLPGGVTFMRKEDRLYAYVRLFAGGPKVWHQQYVYTGGRCPNISDDKNGDGYIDIVEAKAVLGDVIIPLDSDIGSQMSGRRFFPLSDLSGSYAYERITSFKRFFRDLKSPDPDPKDNIVKIGENEGFSFIGKTVMVQGTADTIVYPETVASEGRYKVFQTLPIACATFTRPEETVGSPLEEDVIPGPIAPVVEGQDQPAPPGAGEYYPPEPGSDNGTGTNSNEEGETGTSGTEDPENYGDNG